MTIVGTGGSIATVGTGILDLVDYPDTLNLREIDDMLDDVPGVRDVAEIDARRFRKLGSSRLSFGDLLDLREVIAEGWESSGRHEGVVVTHGTATLEETAFFLHLTLKTTAPVVVVGAMRPMTAIGSDAHLNLLNAVRVAACEEARGMGVLVVMDGGIYSARDVTKGSNWSLGSFESPLWGPLGMVWPDGTVDFHRKPLRRHTVSSAVDVSTWAPDREPPKVEIVTGSLGADAMIIEYLTAQEVDALVLNGFPPGLAPLSQSSAIEAALRAEIPVIQASRARGKVILREKSQRGLLSSGDLTAHKARMLTMLVLGGSDGAALQAIFDTH